MRGARAVLAIIAVVIMAIAATGGGPAAAATPPAGAGPRVLILGFDGMDPALLRQYLDEGALPNFQRFLDAGAAVTPFGTAIPPQSPVAWSNFITGRDPGGPAQGRHHRPLPARRRAGG